MNRSRQKRTMATMADWSKALRDYSERHGAFPRPGYVGPIAGLLPGNGIPATDAWDHPLLYHGSRSTYILRATGRDGISDHKIAVGATTSFDDDFVAAEGVFLRYPEGICGGDGQPDDWDVKKYGECAECHPRRIHRAVTK